ncbi:MAG: hypothetical protein U0807_06090 [Candidatus Binatia bacterium]
MGRFLVAVVTAAVVASLSSAPPARAAKRHPVSCPDARYLVATPLVVREGGLEADAVSVAGSQVAIASGCPAVAARRVTGSRRSVKILVTWKACTGLPGTATLKARIDATCATMAGTFKVSRARPKRRPTAFTAARSRCGDGTLDSAAGERCEPASTGACDADCGWRSASRDDDVSPQAVVVPDFSRITLTAQASGYTHVAGAAGAIPGALPVYVASPNSAHHAFTTAASDGSFAADVIAPPGAWLLVKYDPTNGTWIDPACGDVLQAPVNSAPGAWGQVPWTTPSGTGVPFVLAGSTFGDRVDFDLAGRLTRSGSAVTISGTLTVYSTAALTAQTPQFSILLHRLYDSAGRPRIMANQFFSTILTPSGLPIEHWSGPALAADALVSSALASAGTNVYAAPFTYTMNLPGGLATGTYALALSTFGVGLTGSLGGTRREVNPFLTNHELYLPPFAVGSPATPHLAWGLLTDVISADGSRGTVAAEDAAAFDIANHVATQAGSFVVPRLSKKDGQPLAYRLEPYVPMVSQGERRLANVPTHAFAFPSGSLTVTITRPDGQVEQLGPEPFRGAASRTPASSAGPLLDNGGGHLGDVFQLSTRSGTFDYRFPSYGEYTIVMQGTIDDVYGTTYTGGGTYTVFVAEPLDVEPAVLPMTPLEVGNVLNPGVTVLPGVPADVTVEATLFVSSDPGQAVTYRTQGRANRYGTFTAPADAAAMTMTGAGELRVTTVARYTDPDGVMWMGATRWGQVVAPVNSTFIAHGRHEADDVPIASARQWFDTHLFPTDAHAFLPWATGDVLWQGESEAARVQITAEDTSGAVEAAMSDWVTQNNYFSTGDHTAPPPSFAARAAKKELPLAFSTSTGVNPAEEPADIVSFGYAYAGIERPGERVREMISDDDNGVAYWRYNELYGLQPGMGAAGDLPNDFKFQFGGAVFRDSVHAVRAYGIYASLWVHLPSGATTDANTSVLPPLQWGPGGDPILTLGGQPIDAFVVPLAARPGTILEVGDRFSFSAQLAPTLPASVSVTVTGPDGASHTIAGRANAIGYFYDPAQDYVVSTPGVHHVAVTATFDGATSAGPTSPPYSTGTVLGAVAGGFDVYVVAADTPALPAGLPPWSVVAGAGPVPLTVHAPFGVQTGTVHYTIAMPGVLLTSGTAAVADATATIVYDPLLLAQTYPNIDTDGRLVAGPGLADTVWVNLAFEGSDGTVYAEQLTLQGPDVYLPPR